MAQNGSNLHRLMVLLMRVFRVFYYFLGRLYPAIRRRMGKVPFVYSLYRRYALLQRIDARILAMLDGATLVMMSDGYNPQMVSMREMKVIEELLEEKSYRQALQKSRKILAGGTMFSVAALLGLLRAASHEKAWDAVENEIYPAFRRWVLGAGNNPSDSLRWQYSTALEDAALHMLESAQLSLALRFFYLAESVAPRNAQHVFIALIHYIEAMQVEVTRRGTTIRAGHGAGEINQIGSIVWGEKYLDAFMTYNVRSMLAPGNMPALAEKGILVHSIVTTEAGRDYVLKHPVYKDLAAVAQVEFFCFPESLLNLSKGENSPDRFTYLLYGILDHINIFLARGLKANLFLIPVDSIVANPSFTHMRRYLEEGYDSCGAGNLVAEREGFLPALDARFGGQRTITIDTKSLATLALQHPHNYITSQLIHDKNRSFGKHPRELFWPVPGGIAVHSIYTHPLATAARRICSDYPFPYAWVDFLLPVRMFPDPAEFGKYKIIDNAAEAYINNFAPAGRKYETTGRVFMPQDFAAAHTYSHAVHRSMLNTRQFIPCDYAPLVCSNDIDADIQRVKSALSRYFDDRPKRANPPNDGVPCHLCKRSELDEVIDLGKMPLSHQLRTSLSQEEPVFPVHFHYCNHCGLLQMRDTIPPDALYDAETYSTGFQQPKHLDDLITTVLSYRAPGPVLDVGCNDGSLLRVFEAHGFSKLAGVEPNSHAADMARRNPHHHIITDYLTPDVANSLKKQQGSFDFIVARHVLEHVTDLESFFAGVDTLLSKDGLFIVELPHVETGFNANNPVILWEEHVNYFTEPQVEAMFAHFGFTILDRRHYAFGGGSVAFIARRDVKKPLDVRVSQSHSKEYFENFDHTIRHLRKNFRDAVETARESGYAIAVYGAAPRSCTLLNYAGLGYDMDYVIDDRADIQGRIMPGTQLTITPLDTVEFDTRPLLVLLGVGAEHEHKVLTRLKQKLGYAPISVSLFPPRDVHASLDAARLKLLMKPAKTLKIA